MGNDDEIEAWIGPGTEVINLGGRTNVMTIVGGEVVHIKEAE